MAILGKIRSQGLILILVIALALFAFIIQELLTSNGASKDATLGVVGDTEIDRIAFSRKVENTMQSRTNMSTVAAVNTVWNSEVRTAVLNAQIEAAGIDASEQAIKDQISRSFAGEVNFQDSNGMFSEVAMNTYVTNRKQEDPNWYNQIWLPAVDNIKNQVKQQQFFNLLKSGIIGTQADGELEYRLANDTRTFSFVNIPFTSIADSLVDVSKSEIQKYISDHKSEFEVEAQRDLQYVFFEEKASNEDRTSLKNDLASLLNTKEEYSEVTKQKESVQGLKDVADVTSFVNANSDIPYSDEYTVVSKLPAEIQAAGNFGLGQTFGPYVDGEYVKISKVEGKKTIMDSVKNRHILVKYAGATRSDATRSKEEAQQLADSIFATIGSSKSRYLTKWEYFKDNQELAKGEDLGWTVYSGNASSLAEGYRNFLFDNPEGTIGIAESSFGFHIIYLEETKTPITAIQLATVAKEIEASKATRKQLFTNVQKFQQAVNSDNFAELAKEYGVTVKPVNSLKVLDENLPGLERNRAIVKWAFDEKTDIGEVDRFETPTGYVLAQLTKKSDAGTTNPEDASLKVTPILRNKKKAAMILEKIKATDINEIAKNQNQPVRSAAAVNRKNPTIPGVGEEPVVVGTAFGIAQGKTSKPVVGEKGVFVVKVTAIEKAPDLQNYTSDANELAQRTANAATSQLVEALKKSMAITDNRATFY